MLDCSKRRLAAPYTLIEIIVTSDASTPAMVANICFIESAIVKNTSLDMGNMSSTLTDGLSTGVGVGELVLCILVVVEEVVGIGVLVTRRGVLVDGVGVLGESLGVVVVVGGTGVPVEGLGVLVVGIGVLVVGLVVLVVGVGVLVVGPGVLVEVIPALVEVSSALVEVVSVLVEVRSALVEVISVLAELISAPVEVVSALAGVVSALVYEVTLLLDGGRELVEGALVLEEGMSVLVEGLVTVGVSSAVVWVGDGHSKLTASNPSSHWIQVVISTPSSAYPAGQLVQFTVPIWSVTVPGIHWEHVSIPVSTAPVLVVDE